MTEGRTIDAIKQLRAATKAPLKDGKDWVDPRLLRLGTTPTKWAGKPCPYCGMPLRTDQARQCFECGMDWHDPGAPLRRSVTRRPDRRRTSVMKGSIACDDWPIYTVHVIKVGHQPAKVFSLLRKTLQVTPATAKAMLSSPRIEVARGPRLLVEPVADQFRSAGAEVEMKSDGLG
jgi:hypothetical protein